MTNKACGSGYQYIFHAPLPFKLNTGDAINFNTSSIALIWNYIFNAIQRHLANQKVRRSDHRHFKPEVTAAFIRWLHTMLGYPDGSDFPAPKAFMFIVDNDKRKPDGAVPISPIMERHHFQAVDRSSNNMIDLAGILLYLIIQRCSVAAAVKRKN
jgi:hypothetical protein